MKWIALTGGIGSGKTAVATFFMELGIPVIDSDSVAHELTTHYGAAIPLIRQTFGDEVIDFISGSLKRDVMRYLITSNPDKKQQLESILHPLIFSQMQEKMAEYQGVYGLLAIPLLVEVPIFQTLVHRVLLVDCPENQQVQRIMSRSRLSQDEALAMIRLQVTRQERKELADDIIDNSGSLKDTQAQVQRLHQCYLAL